jgi:TetR/AcrR family transcriptional regulator, repressor for uid operon
MPSPIYDDPATRERILRATFKVLCRHGYGKFSLSDVATQAGISRPTLYKCFASKDELLAAFSEFEVLSFEKDLAHAVEGLEGRGRLDAIVGFLADFYRSYQMRGLIEIEPALVLEQMSTAIPVLSDLIARELDEQVPDSHTVATALVRIGTCHYLMPSSDDELLLPQLRAAAGLR